MKVDQASQFSLSRSLDRSGGVLNFFSRAFAQVLNAQGGKTDGASASSQSPSEKLALLGQPDVAPGATLTSDGSPVATGSGNGFTFNNQGAVSSSGATSTIQLDGTNGIVNNGGGASIDAETTGVGVSGQDNTINNQGTITGGVNAVTFENGGESSGTVNNSGTISSDSRGVNIGGNGITVNNQGAIVGTGDQRNGTVYSDGTSSNTTVNNAAGAVIDAGAGNQGAGISLSQQADGGSGQVNVINEGSITGRGQAEASAPTSGDGIRIEGDRAPDGVPPGLFEGNIVNAGTVTSESEQGTTAGFRTVDGLSFQGNLLNAGGGEISGVNNGVYFGEADHSGGRFLNAGTVSSDSRAVNIDGDGLTVVNAGTIVGAGDQRNGTVYSNATASDFGVLNTQSGSIDAGEGNRGAGVSLASLNDGSNGQVNLVNQGSITGRGQAEASAATAGDGVRLEGDRGPDGVPPGNFEGNVVNAGSITSESTVGATSGLRALDGLGVQGNIVNTASGEISGANNGVYFGEADHSGGRFLNAGTVSSDSRAVNIDGEGLTVLNAGTIVGTGDQRNGTIYSDATASNFNVLNTARGSVDAGEGNEGAGVSLAFQNDGSNGQVNLVNKGSITGRGQAEASAATAGDGVRLEGDRGPGGVPPGIFEGNVLNSGSITSESTQAAGFRTVDGLGFQGNLVNGAGAEISGTNNGVYFGEADHSGGRFLNAGSASSDSRAVNIDGEGLSVVNTGTILGTGDQRNGTVYADATSNDYSITNTSTGRIDAGRGNDGSGVSLQTGETDGETVNGSVYNAGVIRGRGEAVEGNTVGDGVRIFGGGGNDVTFSGDISNSGRIRAADSSSEAVGISIEDGVSLDGQINNSGTIRASETAIDATSAGGDVNVVNSGRVVGDVNLSAGNDTYDGSEGRTRGTVNAGAGNDTVIGGRGNDVLDGGSGNDTLSGGRGRDTFVASTGRDTITDFNARRDSVDASAFDFNSFGDLNISQQGDDTVVDFGDGNTTTLAETNSNSLSENNFQFS